MTDHAALIESLTARVELLEDKLSIANLLATYGPAVDSGCADEVADLWLEDGVYDVDSGAMHGRDDIAAMVRSSPHQRLIMNGSAHFMSPPHIRIDNGRAVATCHSQLVVNNFDDPTKFEVLRITANRWELAKAEDGTWHIERRTGRILDGRTDAREILRAAATD